MKWLLIVILQGQGVDATVKMQTETVGNCIEMGFSLVDEFSDSYENVKFKCVLEGLK
jgi:hypothetical protein